MFVARFPAARALPRLAVAAALTGALGLVACGGNVSRSEPYVPDKLVSFGDELSAFTSDGHKYSVNGLSTTNSVTAFDCRVNPTWAQYVAQGYGFVYPQCNPNNVVTKAETRAVVDAKIDDVVNQVNAYGTFTPTTLVTLMACTMCLMRTTTSRAMPSRVPMRCC
jgi:outer membrane lipase/esterase